MLKYGIKLWTVNKDLFGEAMELLKGKEADFIELYIVPDTFELRDLEIFKKNPISIHTPHSAHNFNIFDLSGEKIKLFKDQVIKTADFFNSKHIVVHAGTGDGSQIFKNSIDKIYDSRIIIENMPKISAEKKDNGICFGYSREHLDFIKNWCGLNICLDIGHAVKGAVSQKIYYKDYLKKLIGDFSPNYFHINDVRIDNEIDEHLNLGDGDLDLEWIKNILINLAEQQDVYLVFEVPKNRHNLQNDLKNIRIFNEGLQK